MLIVLLLAPFCAAVSIGFLHRRKLIELAHMAGAFVTLMAGVSVAANVWVLEYTAGSGAASALGGFLRADALSPLLVMTILFAWAVAAVFALGYTHVELK